MHPQPKGTLIIIGGHEDKDGDRPILAHVAEQARHKNGNGRLVIVTVATEAPAEMAEQYTTVFTELGVHTIDVLDIRTRAEAHDQANVQKLAKAAVIFFTGGDQLRITSQIGDSPVFRCMHERYQQGGTIVGTSAGAAAMPETMLVGGPSDTSSKISGIAMAPGLGLLASVVVDSHFAERGRMGRLLGAIAQNPKNLGVGIDEDTAILVKPDQPIQVLGSGAVYVVDGQDVSYSSLSEKNPEGIVSIFDVKVHVLGADDRFDLRERRPVQPKAARHKSAR
jgi:cyanophycinase